MVNGHSWVTKDYEEVSGTMYELHILCVIDGDRVVEKEIKRVALN